VPAPTFKGVHFILKGKKNDKSKIFFLADDVVDGAKIAIQRKGIGTPAYAWSGTAKVTGKKVQSMVSCDTGDTMLRSRGRLRGRPTGAGDIVDVTVTITNIDGTYATVDEVVLIE
jgi:hypothetical protein